MSWKCRNTVRRPTSARAATVSALGENSPAWMISSMAVTIRARLSCPRRRRPSVSAGGLSWASDMRSLAGRNEPVGAADPGRSRRQTQEVAIMAHSDGSPKHIPRSSCNQRWPSDALTAH